MSKLIREATLTTELQSLNRRIASVERAIFGEWTAFPYNTTNFLDVGGADQVVQYRVSGGNVQLRGVCVNQPATTVTLGTTVIGTLPLNAIPLKTIQFPVYIFDTNGISGTMGQLQIDTNGALIIMRDLTGRAQIRTNPYYVTVNNVNFSTG